MQRKIVRAGTMQSSFALASEELEHSADFAISAKEIERLTERIGAERSVEIAASTTAYVSLPLVARKDQPEKPAEGACAIPEVAVVSVDGGRYQELDFARPSLAKKAEKAKKNGAAPSVSPEPGMAAARVEDGDAERVEPDAEHKGTHWRENKIGVLMTMTSAELTSDPCPELPKIFADPARMTTLARELKTKKSASVSDDGEQATPSREPEAELEALRSETESPSWQPPEVVEKTYVGTSQKWAEFGPQVASAAWSLRFFVAWRRAFVADGSKNNWTIWRERFSNFTPILDIIHAISYVFAAALAGRTFATGWPIYVRWVTWVWQGEVAKVIVELESRQKELGEAETGDGATHPRRVVSEALRYLKNHQDKMNYPEYRRLGLPITSAYVESAVKQFNRRVKGTEKFWAEPGIEAVMTLRADYLTGLDPMDDFWKRRQAAATGQNSYASQSNAA